MPDPHPDDPFYIGKLAAGDLDRMRLGRTALITGASRGLGRALASELAQRGWALILDARSQQPLKDVHTELSQRTQVIAIPGDVAEQSHRRALSMAARQAGGVDVVINNASLLGPSPLPSLLNYPLDALQEVFRVNLFGILALLQELKDEIKTGGRIINVTSDAAVEAYPGWGGYGSSKAALEQLSAVLAVENPQWRVYWVDPGDMRTQMHQDAFPGEDISDRPLPEETVPGFLPLLEGRLPSGRYRSPALILEIP